MVSKKVLDLKKVQEAQATWATTHGAAVAAQLVKVIGKVDSVEALVAALARLVEKRFEAMSAADAAHRLELADDVAPRDARDAAAEAVAADLQFVRSAVAALYGPRVLASLGLAEPVSRDPVAIEAAGKAFVKAVASGALELPAPRSKAASVDLKGLAASVKANLPALTAALASVSAEAGEAQATQQAKNAAISAFEATFTPVNDVLYALAALAGARELGDKLPALPRSKPRAADEVDADEPAPPA
jgi:hypothetical protein